MSEKGDSSGSDPKSDEKLFLGRTSNSWMKILGFYFVFYAILIGIFAIFIAGFGSNLPENEPYWHGRALQSPGLSYMPNLNTTSHSDWINTHHSEIDPTTAFVYKT